MASTDRQRWARVSPHLAWKHPGLPTKWTRVLDRNPDAMEPGPLPGYVWLATPGKVLHADQRHVEFPDRPPEGTLMPKKIHRRRDADRERGSKSTGTLPSPDPGT